MKYLLALVCLLLFACTISANYYLASDGFYYYPGYTQAYTRTLSYVAGYWYRGCYYPGYYTPSYTPYYATAAVKKDFDTQLLDIVDKYKNEEAKVNKLRAVGITLPNDALLPLLRQNQSGPYSYSGSYNQTLVPVNANTQYGYSLNTVYGNPLDINQAFLLSSQLTAASITAGSRANSEFHGIVKDATIGNQRVAEITAKRDFALAMLQNLQASPAVATTGISFQVTPGQQPTINAQSVSPDIRANILKSWGDMAAQKCSGCHFGTTIKGGFDLQKYLSMSQEEKQRRVWPRILPQADEKIRMPFAVREDGSHGPGQALTAQEYQLFLMVQPADNQSSNTQSPVLPKG
jgi:hypothetical protein